MKARLRSLIFWLHLVAGVIAGAVILIMSVTGMLLMYERQIVEWADRGYRSVPPAGATRLPAEELLARAAAARPDAKATGLALQSDPEAPAQVALGRGRSLYLDPYTGKVLGEGSPAVRKVFRVATDWHRWLGAGEKNRKLGRAVTGASNLAFLFLVVSGIYLWVPRRWTWAQIKNVSWFRRGLSPKARDFNWHNVIGLWAWIPLFFIVLSGVLISYPWATNLLYRMTGEEPPARQESGGARSEGAGARRPGEGGRAEGGRRPERTAEAGRGREREVRAEGGAPRAEREGGGRRERGERPRAAEGRPPYAGLDPLWAVAEKKVPGWKTLSVRVPEEAGGSVTFTVLAGHRGRPDLRSQLTLGPGGEEEKWETFASQGLARRLRSWGRWIHTGEALGIVGQTIAGIASAGAAVLVWTGIALAWRRLFRRAPKPAKVRQERVDTPPGSALEA